MARVAWRHYSSKSLVIKKAHFRPSMKTNYVFEGALYIVTISSKSIIGKNRCKVMGFIEWFYIPLVNVTGESSDNRFNPLSERPRLDPWTSVHETDWNGSASPVCILMLFKGLLSLYLSWTIHYKFCLLELCYLSNRCEILCIIFCRPFFFFPFFFGVSLRVPSITYNINTICDLKKK